MRRKLVIGNWKMHGNLATNQRLMRAMQDELAHIRHADIALCVPFTYLYQAQQLLGGTHIAWGAQNVSQFEEGAYTGSISARMIADFACAFAIIGHSERRAITHESYVCAARRFANVLDAGLTPVFCVGETQQERERGVAHDVVANQMNAVLDMFGGRLPRMVTEHDVVFAYEPVWAIGTGQNATPQEAQGMHCFIRELVATHDVAFADNVRIIYGGSVTPTNAGSLFAMPDIDGGLIGRWSLDPLGFRIICEAAADAVSTLSSMAGHC